MQEMQKAHIFFYRGGGIKGYLGSRFWHDNYMILIIKSELILVLFFKVIVSLKVSAYTSTLYN